MCWPSSVGEDEYQVFQGTLLHRRGQSDVWSVRDDHAIGHWEPAKGQKVCLFYDVNASDEG